MDYIPNNMHIVQPSLDAASHIAAAYSVAAILLATLFIISMWRYRAVKRQLSTLDDTRSA